MIPLVSPLISLDDPKAATKFDARRRKDRERRRFKAQKKLRNPELSLYHDQEWELPPPPPMSFAR
jgi:hypothetical protein